MKTQFLGRPSSVIPGESGFQALYHVTWMINSLIRLMVAHYEDAE